MTAILTYNDNKMVIFERVSDKQFHQCTNFQAPEMSKSKVHNLIVTVRGAQFSLTESRKIMIKYYPLKSFVQTDKPIYLPGQTVHFRVVTLDTKLRPAKGLYDVIELLDPQQNRIGQWLNATSNGAILQLSYSLNSEVREGWYTISVWMKRNQVNKRFKVEKYVLPKFKVSLQAPNEVSVGKEELEMDVCAKYTYGQPVPGMVNIEICRRPRSYLTDQIPVLCFKEAKQTDKTGCARFNPKMSVFTKIEAKAFHPSLHITASVEEEGTGTSLPAEKVVELSYIIGKLIFVETPKIYNEESTLEGKIKAVHHNDTPVPNMEIQLLNAKGWQDWVLLNLTTDAEGIATFSLNTTLFNGEDIRLKASEVRQDRNFLEPFFDSAHHTVSVFQPPLPFSKSVSSLVVNKKEEALSCDGEETISIRYNFVGETAGNVDVIYLVSVKATPSDEYTLTPLSGNEYTSCLCGSERKTLSWTMVPSVLGVVNVTVSAEAIASHASCDNEIVSVPERGRIDTVTRSLVVKAEGTEMKKINNWLLCPNDEVLKEEVELELPDNAIDGSARALVSVLGDIMGRALQNLDGLLKMPYGCGEQNMALLAPNIYILQYLRSTEQLTDDILKKAIHFLTSGYQRQLNYKHLDGSYSAFGIGDGNTWLTAFVVRSFEKAKGGVSDEVTLSAYITAALLEMNKSATDLPVHRSMMCLKESTNNLNNTYTTALMAYVFSLAGDLKTRDFLLQHLDSVSSQEGGLIHWSQSTDEGYGSLSVEIGSYVLLAKLSGSPTTEDLGYASRIVRWLSMQQNYYGGFSSTQDTVVALQALALYSSLVYSTKGSSTVKVNSPSGQLVFDVNQNNKLVYHEKLLKDLGGKVNLEVEGSMCASIQISLHYNIPTPTTVDIFFVEAKPECQTQKNRVTLKLSSLYRGKQQTTNMVILEVTMLSGFVPDPESVANLRQALLVGRVEENEGRVLIYITEVRKICCDG
eukprot:XP_003979617.2 PREDICTED: alpha-2-macroglobulin-P-like [Takifugu rubripes]